MTYLGLPDIKKDKFSKASLTRSRICGDVAGGVRREIIEEVDTKEILAFFKTILVVMKCMDEMESIYQQVDSSVKYFFDFKFSFILYISYVGRFSSFAWRNRIEEL